MNKDSKILVTGYKGFVGNNLYLALKNCQFTNVHGISREDVDLSNFNEVNSYLRLEKYDYIFICSAKCGGLKPNLDNPYSFLYDNLTIQNSIIHASILNKVKKVLFIGSNCIYPSICEQPLREEYILSSPFEPVYEGYSIAKIAGIKMCEYANKLYGTTKNNIKYETRFISLVPCNLYGPKDNFDLFSSHVMAALIRKFIEAKKNNSNQIFLWGTGLTKREFLFVDDFSECMIWAMDNIEYTNTFLNVGSGIEISIKELSEKIARTINYSGEIIFDNSMPKGVDRKCLDVSKINKLGWKYTTNLDDGIIKTIEYFLESDINENKSCF